MTTTPDLYVLRLAAGAIDWAALQARADAACLVAADRYELLVNEWQATQGDPVAYDAARVQMAAAAADLIEAQQRARQVREDMA